MRLSDLIDLPAAVIRNVASSYLGFAAQAATALLLTPFLVHRLGPVQYGVWILLTTILGYFQLLELGIMPAVIRYVSHHRARSETADVNSVIGSALLVLLGLAAVTVPITALVAWLAPPLFHLLEVDQGLLTRGIVLVGIAAIVAYFRRLFTAVIVGHQQFPLLNLCSASGTVLGALASVVVVRGGHGILALVGVTIGQLAYETLFQLAVLYRIFGVATDPRLTRREHLRKLVGYSAFAFLSDVSLNISHRMDAVVIGLFLPEAAITSYSLGTKIAQMIENFTDPLIDTFFPFASEVHAAAEPGSLRRLLTNGTRISLILAAPALTIAGWYGGDLIAWWLGAEFVAASLPVLQVFLAIVGLSIFEATAARILLGVGQVRFDAAVSVGSAALNLTLSLILVQRIGIIGVAYASLIPCFIGKVLVSLPYTCRITGTPIAGFLVRAIAPAGVIAAACLGIMAATSGWFDNRVWAVVAHTAAAGVVTLAVLLAVRPRAAA
jgi:O-antigen/teichoic acid export membrane protein